MAAGTAPFTYQWRKNGVTLVGASAATYSIGSAVVADAGSYSVVVTNSAGAITSAAAILEVAAPASAPPVIATPPAAQTVGQGETATFTVVASGAGPFTYQWSKGSSPIANATNAIYTINAVSTADAGSYSVVVTNAGGSVTSATAVLNVTAGASAPVISTQPVPQSVAAGGSATLAVVASGTAPLAYQWRKEGVAISGATSSTLALNGVTSVSAGSYSVIVSNSAGSVTSTAATLTVSSVAASPVVTTQPASQAVAVGGSATLSVVATGTAPLAYQWRKDGTAIAGATRENYALSSFTAAAAGSYTVVVSNSAGSVTSSPAAVSLAASTGLAGAVFGTFAADAGSFALWVRSDRTAVFLGFLRSGGRALLNRTAEIGADGRFQFPLEVSPAGGTVTGVSAVLSPDGSVSGSLTGAGIAISAPARAASMATSALAGYYAAGEPNGSSVAHTIVGAGGESYVLVVTNSGAEAGRGTAGADGAITVATGTSTVAGSVQRENATLVLSSQRASGAPASFVGANDERRTVREKLLNISTRSDTTGAEGNALIAGFVIGGTTSKRVLVRAIGPSLAPFGVSGALPAARLELFRGQTSLAVSNDWGTASGASAVAAAAARKHRYNAELTRPKNAALYYGVRKRPEEAAAELPRYHQLLALAEDTVHGIASRPGARLADFPEPSLPTLGPGKETPYRFPGGTVRAPADLQRELVVADGYAVNLFASETQFPELRNPVQMSFDARGRLWVVTMPSFPHTIPGERPADQILILEDTDRDGRADTCTVFAGGFDALDGVAFHERGVIVSSQPRLLVLNDTDGDGRADTRSELLRGVDVTDSHHGGMVATDPMGSVIFADGVFHRSQFETPFGVVRGIDSTTYRLDPRSGRVAPEWRTLTPNPWKVSFDRHGNLLQRFGGGHLIDGLGLTWTPGGVYHPYGTATVLNYAKGSGLSVISSPNFPDDLQQGYATAALLGSYTVSLSRASATDGPLVAASRLDVLSSKNSTFRPVDVEFGLDGALYVSDFSSLIIGHAQHAMRDPQWNHERGRIWRVTHTGKPVSRDWPRIEGASAAALAALLAHPQNLVRHHARIALRRFGPAAFPALEQRVAALAPDSPEGTQTRLEASWVLAAAGEARTAWLDTLTRSTDALTRAAGVMLLRFTAATAAAGNPDTSVPKACNCAAVPWWTTVPRSSTTVCCEMAKIAWGCCSTMMALKPSSRVMRAIARSSSSTMMGAKPSMGSSKSRIAGSPIRARPMESICCSPPDIWLPMWLRRSARRGNSSYTRSIGQRPLRAATIRFSSTLRDGKISRVWGT